MILPLTSRSMGFETFRDFIEHLDRSGELVRVRAQVDPKLEIATITDRVCKSPAPHQHSERDRSPAALLGGKALLFENVAGSSMPCAINTFGSYWRINQALGSDSLDGLAARVQALIKPEVPTSLMDKMRKLPELVKMASYPPKIVRNGICQQVVLEGEAADLTKLPIIQCWPLDGNLESGQVLDPNWKHNGPPSPFGHSSASSHSKTSGPKSPAQYLNSTASASAASSSSAAGFSPLVSGTGRYITLGGIYTVDPETGARNVGMYRVQIFGPRKAAMHWHLHHDGARHFRKYQKLGKPMPLAIVLGGESVLPYAATAPLPPTVEELLFAGFLNGGGVELVKCRTHDIHVPANAEIVIEGFVDPNEKLYEGPFGDHTGFYSLADWYPAFNVSAITHRRDPIYPTTIVGAPPMEDYFLGKATERIFLPLLQMLVPDIVDYALPISGVFHNCAYIKIRKEYPMQARRVMHAIWGAGQMAFTKFIIVVDEHVNVHDEQEVLFHLFSNCDPGRDTEIVRGPVDILDHASPHLGVGSKIGFDATEKWPGEGEVRKYPKRLEMDAATKALVERRWKEYGI